MCFLDSRRSSCCGGGDELNGARGLGIRRRGAMEVMVCGELEARRREGELARWFVAMPMPMERERCCTYAESWIDCMGSDAGRGGVVGIFKTHSYDFI